MAGTPLELGAVNLRDMGDIVTHGMHGAIGALIVEPRGAKWKVDRDTRAQADVTYQDNGTKRFREFVVVIQDGVGLHTDRRFLRDDNPSLNSGSAMRNRGGADDAEDTGQSGMNFRTEPLWARLGLPPQTPEEVINARKDLGAVLASSVHGDPETPVFDVRAGQDIRFRVVQPAGHPRQHAFTLHGSEWPTRPWARGSASSRIGPTTTTTIIGTQGGIGPMIPLNIVPLHGAGGKNEVRGDFLFRDQPSFQFPGGIWGILRTR